MHLLSEQAQTRYIERQKKWYNLSTHMPWIGMRTAQIEGAHIEYFRGIGNPIGVKVGASMSAEWLQELVPVLNPQNQPGRLTFIHRFGVKDIAQRLPPMIEAVRATGSQVLWVCDPMHGNTETTAGGIKTRRFDNILGEVEPPFRIHEELVSLLGGVHIELTGEDVTECIGGARDLKEADLARAYRVASRPAPQRGTGPRARHADRPSRAGHRRGVGQTPNMYRSPLKIVNTINNLIKSINY